jgi:predicted DNA-binding transcriptional regulator YafY
LAEESGVSEKTIRRDLATFRSAGFPIDEQAGEFGRKSYRIDPRWSKPDIGFTFDEALALYLGRKFLRPLAGTMIWEAAQRAFKKIRATLGESALKYLDKVGGAFHETAFGLSDYSGHGEILDNLLIGIEDRRVVFITYRSQRSTESVTYPIHPYCVKRHEGSLYVHGHKPDDGELRTWKLDRIEQANVDPMPFTMPADLDLEARFAGSLGIYDGQDDLHVKIRFTCEVARYVAEKQWHPSQQLAPQNDGSLIVDLQLSNTVEVKSWILSFGANAEVLEPDELRRDIADDLEHMLNLYSTPHPQTARS